MSPRQEYEEEAEVSEPTQVPEPAAPTDRFRRLPARVRFEDMVEEEPADDPPTDTTPDPNTEVAWRWGMGIAPGA